MKHFGGVSHPPHGLVATGPIVNFRITLHPTEAAVLAAAGKAVPSITAAMMVDTGAQSTCVQDSLLRGLGVSPRRFVPIIGVSGKPEDCPVYPLMLQLGLGSKPGPVEAHANFAADVVGVPDGPQGCAHKGLIGRDFLRYVRLMYDGPTGTFEIEDRSAQPAPSGGWFDTSKLTKKKRAR